jgi:hypothetical protein
MVMEGSGSLGPALGGELNTGNGDVLGTMSGFYEFKHIGKIEAGFKVRIDSLPQESKELMHSSLRLLRDSPYGLF